MAKKQVSVRKSTEKEIIKSVGGRPPIVFTDVQLEQLGEIAPFLNYLQIADYFKINQETFYNLLARDPRISEVYKKAKAEKLYRFGQKLYDKAMGLAPEADTAAIAFYLKTQGRWKENHDQPEINVNVNVLTDRQKEQRALDIKLYDKYRRDMGFGMDSETAVDAEFIVEESKLIKEE
jgi:hypothetical protein